MLKKWIGRLHLWLGLLSGSVIVVVALTGCILVFEQEIKSVAWSFRNIEIPANGKILPPSVLKRHAESVMQGKKANGALYNRAGRAAEIGFYNADPEYYYVVYVNPHSGKVLKVWNEDEDFFHFILHGHYYLWLPEEIGKPFVASATLIFVVMLLSGLVLWWPKNKNAAKQRFSIKWTASWRRKNYDLHNVFGFYMFSIGLILATTGLVWGFAWFSQSLYVVTGGKGNAEFVIPPSDTLAISRISEPMQAVDLAWSKLMKGNPKHESVNISFPDSRSASIFSYVNFRQGTYYDVGYYYFDQHSLKELKAEGPYTGMYAETSFANKLRRMNYDIHVGAILGLPGKLLAFFASLICASLPITGVVIWWGRRKKKKSVKKSYRALKPDLVNRALRD
jgi:uncharacterized iron-regulated membrane protein